MNKDAAQCFGPLSNPRQSRPNPLTQMSAHKTVVFTKTLKKQREVWDGEETGDYRRQRRHLLMLYQVQLWGIWATEGPGIWSISVSPASAVSKSNNKSPIETGCPFFFLGRSTQSVLCYAATVQSQETQAVVSVHLCNAHTFASFSLVVIQLQRCHLPAESSDPFPYCWDECLTLCWIFTWPLTESFSRRCRWTPGFRCSRMSQHKLEKLQSQTLTRQEGESLPQGRSALIPDRRPCSLPELSLDGSDGGLFGGMHVWLPADVRFCMES